MSSIGHPLHPALVHFPIVFWMVATFCDGLSIIGFQQAWPIGGYCLALGLLMGIPAMAVGLYDASKVKDEEAAQETLKHHISLMASAWGCYFFALALRLDGYAIVVEVQSTAIVFSAAGFACLVVGAWFGAMLVYKHRTGVEGS